MKQIGACTIDGAPLPVTMTWTASDNGQLTIVERPPYGTNWVGSVGADLKTTLTKTSQAMCTPGGATMFYDSVFNGVIQNTSPMRLELRGIETPCPPNCVFQAVYSLVRQ